MHIYRYLLLAFVALSANAFGQWTDHYSFNGARFAAAVADKYVVGSSVGLFVYDDVDHELLKVTKTNHLSSFGVSALGSDGRNSIFVGYTNGDLDIVDLSDYTTINIPDLKKSDNVDLSTVNSFCSVGSRLYCGIQSGMLEVDVAKSEVRSYYRLRPDAVSVNAIAVCRDSIYAATNQGLMVADAKSRKLEDPKEWKSLSAATEPFAALAVVGDMVYAVGGTAGDNCTIYRVANQAITSVCAAPTFRSIDVRGSELLVDLASRLVVFDTSFEKLRELTKYNTYDEANEENKEVSLSASSAVWTRDGKIVVADTRAGMVVFDADGESHTHIVNGPANNFCFDMRVSGDVVYVTSGGVTSAYDNKGRAGELYCLADGKWTTSTFGINDIINIAADPNSPDSVYLASWGRGLLQVKDQKIVRRFNAKNSALKDIFGGDNYIRVSAIAYDNSHNLLVSNALVDPGVLIKTPDEEWYSVDCPVLAGQHCLRNMMVTSNNNCWATVPRSGNKGLVVFNINGTPENSADDVFRCVNFSGSDPRYCGPIRLIDENGDMISDNIQCVVEDLDGRLWLATDDGVVTFNADKTLFDRAENPVFNRIKVPRNDGTNLADYLLGGVYVNCIAVDGANRKWIGTSNDGVYLVSADGLEMIKKFTVDNSPLPTNEIVGLAVNNATGEVFIGTPMGVLSYVSDAVRAEETLSNVLIYPNPVRPDYYDGVQIKGLMDQTQVKITDVAGRLVAFSTSNGGLATWNCCGLDGDRVATGVYLVWAISPDGTQEAVTKLTVIR